MPSIRVRVRVSNFFIFQWIFVTPDQIGLLSAAKVRPFPGSIVSKNAEIKYTFSESTIYVIIPCLAWVRANLEIVPQSCPKFRYMQVEVYGIHTL